MENSPLRRLSPELRNRIYELALTSADGITIDCRGVNFRPTNMCYSKASAISPDIALTQTCQEIRRDSLKMYYFLNTFTILTLATYSNLWNAMRFPSGEVRANLNAYRRAIGKDQFSEIRKVTLSIQGPAEEIYMEVYEFRLDRRMVPDIRGTFSSLTHFEVQFEMKQRSDTGGLAILNVMWDMDQSIEQLQTRLSAAEKESNERSLGVHGISIVTNTMSRMVRDLVEIGWAEGEWIGDEVEGLDVLV